MRVITAEFVADIETSAGNTFYSTRTSDQWFRIASLRYDTDGYKTLVGDTTSSNGQVTPGGGYGVTDYLASIGDAATLDAFYTKLRSQRKGNYDPDYTALPIINFVRDKFGLDDAAYLYGGQIRPEKPKNLRIVAN